MKIGAVLLAAGSSMRFGGSDKLLAEVGGSPLIRRAAAALGESSVSDIVIVSGPNAEALRAGAGDGRWRFIENPQAATGMASSLRVGVGALTDQSAGALIALADMPHLSSKLIDDLCAAFALANGEAIVFPESPDGVQGHPVIWPRRHFDELAALDGDRGAKAVLHRHRESWHPLPVADRAAFLDVDTEADLAEARTLGGSSTDAP